MENPRAPPAGTGHSHQSSTNTRVLATGTPIAWTSEPPSHAQAVTSTDASVGPYRLCRPAPNRPAKRPTTQPRSASPLQITHRSLPHCPWPPALTNLGSIDDGKEMLRLRHANAMGAEQLPDVAAAVPAHCVTIVVQLARQYAEMWRDFATELDGRARIIDPSAAAR